MGMEQMVQTIKMAMTKYSPLPPQDPLLEEHQSTSSKGRIKRFVHFLDIIDSYQEMRDF